MLRRLRVGARVRILSGHLALCANMNGAQRVSVLLNFLGGEHEVRLRSDAVEPVDSEDSKLPSKHTGHSGKNITINHIGVPASGPR